MKFDIWQSFNGGVWCLTYHQNLTAQEAARKLAIVVESETELQKHQSGRAEYQIRPERARCGDFLMPQVTKSSRWFISTTPKAKAEARKAEDEEALARWNKR